MTNPKSQNVPDRALGFGIWDLGFAVIKLSVNVNKVATIRNSRGGQVPSVLDAV